MFSTVPFFAVLVLCILSNALPILHMARQVNPGRVSGSTSTPSSSPTSTSKVPASSSTTVPPPPVASDASGSTKFVVAHHMIGNTFSYTVDTWVQDIILASDSGIDAFALNIGSDGFEAARVQDAYDAATKSGRDFKMFISFDMTALACASPADGQVLRNYIKKFSSHPAQFKFKGKNFASTFSGENCHFGAGSVADGWKSQFTQNAELTGDNAVHFVPSFFVDPTTFGTFDGVMDGDFNWNSGWPVTLTTPVATQLLAPLGGLQALGKQLVQAITVDPQSIVNSVVDNVSKVVNSAASDPQNIVSASLNALQSAFTKFIGSSDTDTQHRNGLKAMPNGGSKSYMAAASPWFFTHYGKDSFDKNFIFVADDHLYSRRWESIISTRDQVDIVELITWNDYGESHYLGPIGKDQPNSQAWVDGFEHTGWLSITKHYAAAFKTGSFPDITEDKIVMWSRPHPASATTDDSVGQPTNFEITQDALWAVAMLSEPGTVTLAHGPNPTAGDPNTHTFDVAAGLTKLSIPMTAGAGMYASITRGGKVVTELNPEFTFEGNPKAYNFNAFVVESN